MNDMELKKSNKGKNLAFLGVSLISVFALIVLWNALSPFIIENDNFYLKTIASGEMTGSPEARMYYMGIISGFVLSLLYKITGNGIPWFGILLCLSLSTVMLLLLYKSLLATQKIWQAVIVYLLYMLVFAGIFYQYFAKTHYTLATGFAGASSLFLLFLLKEAEETKKYVLKALPFLFLSLWSLGIRDKAFFMLIPFFGMVFIGKLLDIKKKTFKNLLIAGLSFAFVLAFAVGINKAAYAGEDWKEFRSYTTASEQLFDYEGFPDYETHKETYEKMGITQSSFEAITRHYNIIMDPEVNDVNFTELAKISREERLEKEPAVLKRTVDVFKTVLRYNLLEYQDRPINITVYILYLFVFLLALISKKYRALRDIAFIVVARMFDWFYLVWNGRFPFRVTQIIYIAELVLLVGIIIKYELAFLPDKKTENTKKKIGIKSVFIILLVAITAATIRFGFPVMKKNYESIKGFHEMSVCFVELEDYLSSHPDNFYFFDMSHLYYTEDTLSFKKKPIENYVYMGSWMPNSPWYNNKMKAWGFDTPTEGLLEKDNVYIIYQQVDFDTRDFLDYYFEEHFPGTKIEVVDTFESSNGFVYEILKPGYILLYNRF